MNFLSLALIVSSASASTMNLILLHQAKDMPLYSKVDRDSRNLQLSDECLADNMAASEDPVMLSIISDAMEACPEGTTITPSSMTMDYANCPTFPDALKKACDVMDGTLIPVNATVIECQVDGEIFKLTSNLGQECFAASCDVSQYDEHIANLNSDPEMQALMESMGGECTFSVVSDSAASESTASDSTASDGIASDSTAFESTASKSTASKSTASESTEHTFSGAYHMGLHAGMVALLLVISTAQFA